MQTVSLTLPIDQWALILNAAARAVSYAEGAQVFHALNEQLAAARDRAAEAPAEVADGQG